MIQYAFKSQIGTLYLSADDKYLRGLHFKKQDTKITKNLNKNDACHNTILQTISELKEYFQGNRKKFSVKYKVTGTDFQESVWKELSRIPFGKTISYAELATKIENPKAVRAAGSANGKNPISIIVPCHRVIQKNGSIGGYGGGVPTKIKLLKLES